MVDDAGAGTPTPTPAAAPAAPKPKAGWLRHVSTDTFHEVEDVGTVHAAYPGQYEEASKPGANSKKIGWPVEEPQAAD